MPETKESEALIPPLVRRNSAACAETVMAEASLMSPTSSRSLSHKRRLTLFTAAGIIFFTATGGAYGTEAAVRSVGPLYLLLTLAIFPFLWSVPIALTTTELSTILPHDGGLAVWAREAFGEFWGFQGGFWSWAEGTATLAVYPAVIVDYLQACIGHPFHKSTDWAIRVLLAIAVSVLNLRGVKWVGVSSAVMCVVVLVPLLMFVLISIPYWKPQNWGERLPSSDLPDMRFFINIIIWNLAGYDNIGALAGEVDKPGTTLPKAQFLAITVGSLGYLLPIMAGIAVDGNPAHWHEGYFADLARRVGGHWFELIILLGAVLSRFSNFIAELCTGSFFLQGMSDLALLPAVLSWRHPTYDTPAVAIALNFFTVVLLSFLPLGQILQIANTFTIAALALSASSLMKLRISHPDMHRPYKLPIDTPIGFSLFFLPAIIISIAAVACSDGIVLFWSVLAFAAGVGMHFFFNHSRRKAQWFFLIPGFLGDLIQDQPGVATYV